ncbi:Eco57I restriction-modification methylase domain-containing protein [Thermococcus sp.]
MMSPESKDVAEKARLIESLLRNLEAETTIDDAMDIFREIFEHWGFDREDDEIEREDLDEFVDENTGELRIISIAPSTLNFYVIYAETWKDTLKYRQKLVKNLLKFTSYSSDISFANFILVLDVKENPKSQKHKYWKLIIPIYQRKLESAKLNVYVIDPEEKKFRTLAANIAKVAMELSGYETLSASLIRDVLDKYMLVKPLTEEFFREYKRNYYLLRDWIIKNYHEELKERYQGKVREELPENIFVERAARTFAHTFFNRLMFVYFLQKKGWILKDQEVNSLSSKGRKLVQDAIANKRQFVSWLWNVYEESPARESLQFYRDILRNLFLNVMNKPAEDRYFGDTSLPGPIFYAFKLVPYLNGGLFEHAVVEGVDVDEIITEIPDDVIKDIIFGFFEEYNFTVTEETPYEVEVAVDPAMLGKIYESLIAEEEKGLEEKERRVSGIFYTPRSEVDFMCRMAIYQYLKNNIKKLDDNFLLRFVFTPIHDWENKPLPRALIKAIEDVKIVDPAAGSGAFVVGMFHLLVELYKKAEINVDYERKLKIIQKNIYGVDIKEWAIRVAKLRLWLALIEEEQRIPNEPILPNLGTKLLVGDSLAPQGVLIEGEGGKKVRIDIPTTVWLRLTQIFERLVRNPSRARNSEHVLSHVELLIKEYSEASEGHFEGEVPKEQLIELKKEILLSAINFALKDMGSSLDRATKIKLEALKEALKRGTFKEIPFVWELDFPDVVLERRGFDIVIANPPYVRHENIYPEYYDLAEFQMFSDKKQKSLKKAYKNKIKTHMETIIEKKFKHKIKLSGRSDLYAYFFIQGVNLLKPNGALVFITSNSWLDVDFGTALQEFFIRFTHLSAVIDYTKRSFEQADVNTVITVLTRKAKELFNTVEEEPVNFVLLKRDFNELLKAKNGESGGEGIDFSIIENILRPHFEEKGIEVFGGTVHSYEDEDVRVRTVRAVELAKMGGFKIGRKSHLLGTYNLLGEYKGMKWGGILIRAPRIFYVILDKGKGKLVRLGEIADVETYLNTGGADKFFIVKKVKSIGSYIEIENTEFKKTFLVESQFLRPLIRSPRDLSKRIVEPDTQYYILDVPPNIDITKYKVHEYIKFGEEKGYHKRSGPSSRSPWWKLPKQAREGAPLLFPRSFNVDFTIFYNPYRVVSNRFFRIVNLLKVNEVCMYLSLNSTLSYFMVEILGRKNLGEGALEFLKPDIEELPVATTLDKCNVSMLDPTRRTIFEELGLPKPDRDLSNINPEDVSLDRVLPDRRELDRVIFEALGLTEEEQLEVYKAVVELVKARLVKAKTFSKKKK